MVVRDKASDDPTVTAFSPPLSRLIRLRKRYLAGANRHIQQESTFWRRSLWERAGASLSEAYKDVGDVDLWVRFFRQARLYPIDALIGGWREHPDSISHSDLKSYNRNLNTVIELELDQNPDLRLVQLLKRIDRSIKRIPKVRVVWQRLIMDAIIWCMYRLPGPDLPPTIRYQGGAWEVQTTPPWFRQ